MGIKRRKEGEEEVGREGGTRRSRMRKEVVLEEEKK